MLGDASDVTSVLMLERRDGLASVTVFELFKSLVNKMRCAKLASGCSVLPPPREVPQNHWRRRLAAAFGGGEPRQRKSRN